MAVEFTSAADYLARVGTELGSSEWLTIDQERIDRFAETTGDFQWIHVDPERAAAGPFGATIAHGFLTLSLLPMFDQQIYTLTGARMVVNYGLNKVRFLSPVVVGSRIRGTARLAEVTEVGGGIQPIYEATVEIEGSDKPALIAECIHRIYF